MHEEGGANLSVQDRFGCTLLHHAVGLGSKEIVKYIIDNCESVELNCFIFDFLPSHF